MEGELKNAKIKTEGLQKFIDKAKQVTCLEALTPELVHEFIERIMVSAPEYKNGKRCQKIEIHYNGVGIIREPTAEEMEEYFQKHIKNTPFLKAKRHSHKAIPYLHNNFLRYKSFGAPSLRWVPQAGFFFIDTPNVIVKFSCYHISTL